MRDRGSNLVMTKRGIGGRMVVIFAVRELRLLRLILDVLIERVCYSLNCMIQGVKMPSENELRLGARNGPEPFRTWLNSYLGVAFLTFVNLVLKTISAHRFPSLEQSFFKADCTQVKHSQQ